MPKDADALAEVAELLARAASGRASSIAEAFNAKPEAATKPTLLSRAERLAAMKEALRKRNRARD
jgi:hypothetical protein